MKQVAARKIDLIFLKKYYLDGWTLQRIGTKFDVTRQRAQQRIVRAKKWVEALA